MPKKWRNSAQVHSEIAVLQDWGGFDQGRAKPEATAERPDEHT
jgi:hypothetical protein